MTPAGEITRPVGCDMSRVLAWCSAPNGCVDVWLDGGSVARLPIEASAFGLAHADALGYKLETPTAAQQDLPGVTP